MWFVMAVLGAVLVGLIDPGLSLLGALIGGLVGWRLAKPLREGADARLGAIEARLGRVEAALRRLEAAQGAVPTAGQAPREASATSPRSVEVAEPPVPRPQPLGTLASLDPRVELTPAGSGQEGASVAEEVGEYEPSAPPPPTPAEPVESPEVKRPAAAWEWLLRGNPMARVGVVILFFGVGFLLKYGYQHFEVPIEVRLAGVALGALILLGVGWRLRLTREGYGLALQGGGIGLLYLTIFAALRLFELIPAGAAFALLLLVVALSVALAVLQDSLVLAVLGASGGFLAPILASTGAGSHRVLFGYYALLNGGILAIAWFKAWRVLNLVGFVFTFGIATAWGVLRYQPEQYASSQAFLVLFFLMYLAIPVLFARREAGPAERHLDTTLIFGLPLVTFGLQVGLVRDFEYGSAWSALALGGCYLLLARALWSRRAEGMGLLAEAFLALGLVFLTLAIPLAFDGRWTSAAWALEGSALVWVGVRQQRRLVRWFGVLLQALAGGFYLGELGAPAGHWPLLNPLDLTQLGALLAVVVWLGTVRRLGLSPLSTLSASAARGLAAALFLWGNAVLLRALHHWGGVPYHLGSMLGSDLVQVALSLFWTLLALAAMLFATRRGWRSVWLSGAVLMAVVVVKLFLVELSKVGTVERIISFLGVGLLMLVIGYLAPAPPRQVRTRD